MVESNDSSGDRVGVAAVSIKSRKTTKGGAHAARAGARVTLARAPRSSPRARGRRPRPGEQLVLARTGGWGGRRKNAGRKRAPGKRSCVPHATRPGHKGRHPVHVTLRARSGLPSFRQQLVYRLFTGVLRDQRQRKYKDHFRVVHFSVQPNHLHLIIEADTERAASYQPLRSGVSGLAIAFARRLNKLLRRKGSVWADRFHRHDLKSPLETSRALGYVFDNYTRHGERSYGEGVLDLFSSAPLFDGWAGPRFTPYEHDHWRWPVCRSGTWLLTKGYLEHGRLTITPRR